MLWFLNAYIKLGNTDKSLSKIKQQKKKEKLINLN